MKRRNAIVALLLTLSLLVSSMTVFASAAVSVDSDNKTGAATQNDATSTTIKMIETLISSKSGKVNGLGRPVYATDSASATVFNVLNGETTSFTLNGNEKSGYGIFEVYDVKYGADSFMRINPSQAGLDANDGKILSNVYFGISSSTYAEYSITTVPGDLAATMSSAEGYFVYDYEFASEYLIPSMSLSPITRAGKDGSFSLAGMKHYALSNYASYIDGGKWAHFTLVGDIKNNKTYLFINGKLVDSLALLTSLPDSTASYDALRFEGWRLATGSVKGNEGMNLYIDNMAVRFYTGDEAEEANIAAAIANKNISLFKDHYQDKGTTLPPVATVNGVVYNSAAEVGAVVTGNPETPYEIDILRKFSGSIAINADAVINTHGYVGTSSFTFPAGAHYESEDGYITVDAPVTPNSLSQKPSSTNAYKTASVSPVAGNKASGVTNAVSSSILVLTNVDNKQQSVEFNYLTTSINQIDIASGATKASNKLVDYPYGVFSFDLVSFSDAKKGSYYLLGRGTGPLNLGGGINFTTLLADIPTGEVAQFSIAFGPSATAGEYSIRIFRNGTLLTTSSFKVTDETMYFEAFRLFPTGGHFAMDNIYSTVSQTSIFDADGNLLDEYNQFVQPEYQKLSLPSVATVNGVTASVPAAVTEQLNTNALMYQQYVNVKHAFSGTISVNVSAVIETNGFVGTDSFVFGEGVTYVQDGTKIITSAPLSLGNKLSKETYPSDGTYKFTLSDITTPDNEWFTGSVYTRKGTKDTEYYMNVYSVTNAYDGSKYYGWHVNPAFIANSNKTDDDTYINIYSNKTYNVDASSGNVDKIMASADEEYFVFDIDIYTEGNFPSFGLISVPTWVNSSGSKVGDYANTNRITFSSYIASDYVGWTHFTIVGDVKNNTRHIYVNGEHKGTTTFAAAISADKLDSITGIKLYDMRLGFVAGVTLNADMKLYFDNISIRSFDATETDLVTAVASKTSINGWSNNHAVKSTDGDSGIVASVDGTPFINVDEAVQYAFNTNASQLCIYGDYDETLEISKDISVYVMNGNLKYTTNTHKVTTNGDGLYTFTTAKDNELNTVYVVYDRFTFEDNSGIGGYEAVKFGNGSQFAYTNDNFVTSTYFNGKYYTFNGKWEYETNGGSKEFNGVVNSDCNFKLLIPQYDTVDAECMFSYKLNGGDIVLANSVDELVAILNSNYETLEISVYEDIKYSAVATLANIEVTGALTINLNGNDLILDTLAGAAFALVSDNSSLVLKSAKAGSAVHYAAMVDGALASGYLVAVMANDCSVTVNGANMTVYAGGLLTDNGGSGNTVTVTGGTYYRTLSSQDAYVTVKGGMNVNISGATFVATANGGVWFASAAEANTSFAGAEINVNRTTVIGLDGNALVKESQDSNGEYVAMSFKNFTYVANNGKFSADATVAGFAKVGTNSYTNVMIPDAALADGMKLLYQNKEYSNTLYTPAYLNGTADYTLTATEYSAVTTYKIGSPYVINVNGMKYNLTLYSHFNINLYIPVSETAKFIDHSFDGAQIKVIDGVEYYVFTKSVNANEVADDVSFTFTMVNNEAYVVTLNIVDYASGILAKANVSDTSYTPQLMFAMLEYASSVYAYEGKDNSEIAKIVAKYEKYRYESEDFGAIVATVPLAQFLSSASMYLNDSPSFIFKLKNDFVGTVKVECGNITNFISSYEHDTILLGGVRITNIQDTITLTFTPEGGESVVCTYNLATYYRGVAENYAASTVVNALRNYSNVAKLYMEATH